MRKIIVILLVAAMAACTTIDCPVQNLVYTVYDLKKSDGTPDTLLNDTLWIWTQRVDGTDTVISRDIQGNLELNYFHGTSASSFELPISYTQPEDIMYLLLKNSEGTSYLDTVRIKKENLPHFESVDCQAAYSHPQDRQQQAQLRLLHFEHGLLQAHSQVISNKYKQEAAGSFPAASSFRVFHVRSIAPQGALF